MKKKLLLASMLVICIVFTCFQFFRTSAQTDNESKNRIYTPKDGDIELAATLRQLTDRSAKNLINKSLPDGELSIDFGEGYQNVMLSRLESNGEATDACVTSLSEANAFFGRNLETGETVPQTKFDKRNIDEIAARHGMSAEEFLFYKRMIAQAERQSMSPKPATITIVNANLAGEGFNDMTAVAAEGGNEGATRGEQRLNVFTEAATIWSSIVDTNVPVSVQAKFDPLTCTPTSAVLGSAGSTGASANFTNRPRGNTFYHYALANKLSRSDLNGANPEITTTFNSNLNGSAGCLGGKRFYLGLDNSTPANTSNLLIVVLHELAHGLGFSSLVNSSTGAMPSNLPDAYLLNMYDKTTGKYWFEMTNAERQASAINTHNVLWDGTNVKAASSFLSAGRETSTGRIQLFTPEVIQSGSSISHWDTEAFTNLLMEPSINTGLPLDLDMTRQQMRDIGWYRDTDTSDTVKDSITDIAPTAAVIKNRAMTVTWSNVGGFDQNVTVELSIDNGVTYTILDSNIPNNGWYTFTAPDADVDQARVRVTEYNFTEPRGVSNSFAILNSPTAALVSISGRVVTPSGRGIRSVQITLTDSNGNERTAQTTSFGYYRFDDVEAGKIITLTAKARRFGFNQSSIVRTTNESISDADFVSEH